MTTAATTPAEPRPLPDWPRLPRPVDPAPILPRHRGYAELDEFAFEMVWRAVVAVGHVRDLSTVDQRELANELTKMLLARLHITVPVKTLLTILPEFVQQAQTKPEATYADQVRAALVELGTTRDAITATLTALGITGRPRTDRGCAVYEYLLSLNLPVYRINPLFVSLIDGSRVDVPEVVGDWMADYDALAFPALVRAVA